MEYWLTFELPNFFSRQIPNEVNHRFRAVSDEEAIQYCEKLLPIQVVLEERRNVMEILPVVLERFKKDDEDVRYSIVVVKQWREEYSPPGFCPD